MTPPPAGIGLRLLLNKVQIVIISNRRGCGKALTQTLAETNIIVFKSRNLDRPLTRPYQTHGQIVK